MGGEYIPGKSRVSGLQGVEWHIPPGFSVFNGFIKSILSCDIETAKVLNLISILMDSRLFFEFIHEMYDEKLRIGETEITDRDLNVFFANKAMQSEVVAGWTDTAVKKLKQCFCRMMYEAGLLESSAKPRIMRRIHIDYRTEELLKRNGLEAYLNAVKGVR